MPGGRMKGFRVGSDALFVHGRNDEDGIAHLLRVAAVTTDHSVNFQSLAFRFVDCADQVDADVVGGVPAADRKDKDGVMIAGATDAQPGGKDSLPAFVIRTGRQFRHVIDRGVRLDAAELPEVVDGMTTIRRTSTDSQHE